MIKVIEQIFVAIQQFRFLLLQQSVLLVAFRQLGIEICCARFVLSDAIIGGIESFLHGAEVVTLGFDLLVVEGRLVGCGAERCAVAGAGGTDA